MEYRITDVELDHVIVYCATPQVMQDLEDEWESYIDNKTGYPLSES